MARKLVAAGLRELARALRENLKIGTVVVHPKESAACATRDGSWWVEGPYTENPKLTTGAGDHFNAGFVIGQRRSRGQQSDREQHQNGRQPAKAAMTRRV